MRSLPLALFAMFAPFALVFACNRGSSAPDAGAGVGPAATTAATATGVTPTGTAPTAVPSGTTLQPLATGTVPRPMIKLPDGGFAPAPVPEGGAFALPTFTMPSGMPSTLTIPSTIQVPSALPTAFPSAWPQPPK